MPSVMPNNKYWLRGGKLNQKRILEMTEEEKANVFRCRGTKSGHVCKNPVFRCSECGNYGCDQEVVEKCTDQGFKNDKCLHCGATETRIPVMEQEIEKFKAIWESEVPLVDDTV